MTDTQTPSPDTKRSVNDAAQAAERHAAGAAHALDTKLSGPLAPLESALDDVFGKKASYQLPKDIKNLLVTLAPWLALIGGVLGVFSAYNMWKWAHRANQAIETFNTMLGGALKDIVPKQDVSLGLMFWLSIAMTLLFAVLALLAFPGLKAQKKVGWNLMFYSLIANVAYGVVSLFYSGGGFGTFGMAVISSVIGTYILFQVREHYKA